MDFHSAYTNETQSIVMTVAVDDRNHIQCDVRTSLGSYQFSVLRVTGRGPDKAWLRMNTDGPDGGELFDHARDAIAFLAQQWGVSKVTGSPAPACADAGASPCGNCSDCDTEPCDGKEWAPDENVFMPCAKGHEYASPCNA